jgi:hypothetical protein
MDNKSSPLWLHAYSGRENGLMIVGDAAALEALGRQLQAAVPLDERTAPGWPRVVARPEVLGPYKDLRGFKLSFHIKGDSPVESLLPLRRRALRVPVLLLIAACAITGAVTIWEALVRAISHGL